MDALEIISGEVRERIRALGIDPRTETESAKSIVSEVIADYDTRTLSGRLPLLPDPELAQRTIVDEVSGFGPLQKYLDDPEVEEVWLNGPHAVFISRRGISEFTQC